MFDSEIHTAVVLVPLECLLSTNAETRRILDLAATRQRRRQILQLGENLAKMCRAFLHLTFETSLTL